jgi:predicted ester cyclase
MSVTILEENKAVAQRYLEADDLGFPDPAAILAPGFVSHISSSDETQTADELVAWARSLRDAVAYERTLEDMVAQGDRVAVRVSWRGVHKGPLMGIPATGKRIRVSAIGILRIADGRVAERWLELRED